MFAELFSLLFPKRCFGCNRTKTFLCASCASAIRLPAPLPDPHLFACFGYRDTLAQKLIKKLKYQRRQSIALDLAPYLYDRIIEEIADRDRLAHRTEKIVLIPMPISQDRRRKRGFNQAELLASALARLDSELFELQPKLLAKTHSTLPQVSQRNRQERLRNLEGAFAVTEPERLRNRTVVIVDDVITTGATMSETRKAVKRTGAAMVYGLAVAHG
ncbi:MAG TPA: phosphoribosyltransferase family protein [Candidatus Paceibacterota bacterium]|nr:phosphoribosyltransferase family protein [Candidatus Paceibacterota bacterium]